MGPRNQILIVTGMVLVLPAAAFGTDVTVSVRQQACIQQLMQAESRVNQLVNDKALSDPEIEDVNLYLDELDGACTTKKYNKAEDAVEEIDKMIAPKTKPQETPKRKKKARN